MLQRGIQGIPLLSGRFLCCVSAFLAILIGQGQALVLHPTGEPPANWTGKPHDDVVGRWRTNASCVAVGPNHIITTRHQGGGGGASVNFGGVEYVVVQQWTEPTSADLRVCRLETPGGQPANLVHYVQLYSSTVQAGQSTVLGGYGDGRGITLLTPNNNPYGYQWDKSHGNTVQRWGSNRLDGSFDDFTVTTSAGVFESDLLLADFDDLNVGGAVSYEAVLAEHDSGGGMFVSCGDTWALAALNAYVFGNNEGHDPNAPSYSAFRESTDPTTGPPNRPPAPDPDVFGGIRISSYAAWISGIVPANTCASYLPDLDGDCLVAAYELNQLAQNWARSDCNVTNNYCDGADFLNDGKVSLLDYAYLANWWMASADLLQPCN